MNQETTTAKRAAGILIIALATLSGGFAPLHGEMGIGGFRAAPVPAPRFAGIRRARARVSSDECSALALEATIAKARAEMRTLVPAGRAEPADVGAAMDGDRRLADEVKRTFGNSDLIKSELTKSGECVVTLKLSVNRLQRLAKDL